MPVPELPGMRAFESVLAVPVDIQNLAFKQITEGVELMNVSMGRTAEALDLPGLPPITQMLPIGMGMGAPATAPADKVSEAPVRRTALSAAYGEE